jgi:predicted RND superfamily exporter protein
MGWGKTHPFIKQKETPVKTVRTISNHMGSNGMKTVAIEGKNGKEADEYEVTDKVAADLAEKGLVEIVGDAEEGAKEVKEKSSVEFTDNTTKEKKQIIKPSTPKK